MLDLLHVRLQLDVRLGILSQSSAWMPGPGRLHTYDVELLNAWVGQCTHDGGAMIAALGAGAPRALRHATTDT